jgi:hypothetical protein
MEFELVKGGVQYEMMVERMVCIEVRIEIID